LTITKHDDALRFAVNMESSNGSTLATVYHGERRLCRIVLHGDRLMVTVDHGPDGGFKSVQMGDSYSSATWLLPEHFPSDLFDIDFPEDDK